MNTLTQTITWIPIGERLPDSSRVILIAAPAIHPRPVHGMFYEDEFRFDGRASDSGRSEDVTHWAEPLEMPYPPRP